MTQHFIVIGNPISHSQSPRIHQAFATQAHIDIHYQRQYCPDDNASFTAVVEAFFNGGGIGANVTVPFKQLAYRYCQMQGHLSEHARIAGAVNTLLMLDDKLYGDNTDGQGLVNHITSLGWPLSDARVAIIGAGGAARGVILPLIQAHISSLTLANRTLHKAELLIDELSAASQTIKQFTIETCTTEELIGDYDLIINATSIGLTEATLPLADDLNTSYAYDMMYGRQLPFLERFDQRGAEVSNGFGMLINQAALSFEHWTNHAVDVLQATKLLAPQP